MNVRWSLQFVTTTVKTKLAAFYALVMLGIISMRLISEVVMVSLQMQCSLGTFLCQTDINECMEESHSCDRERGVCENTDGSYRCSCKDGYTGAGTNGSCDGACISLSQMVQQYSTRFYGTNISKKYDHGVVYRCTCEYVHTQEPRYYEP